MGGWVGRGGRVRGGVNVLAGMLFTFSQFYRSFYSRVVRFLSFFLFIYTTVVSPACFCSSSTSAFCLCLFLLSSSSSSSSSSSLLLLLLLSFFFFYYFFFCRPVCLSHCLSLSHCVSVCLDVYLSLTVCLSVCLVLKSCVQVPYNIILYNFF